MGGGRCERLWGASYDREEDVKVNDMVLKCGQEGGEGLRTMVMGNTVVWGKAMDFGLKGV